MPPPSYDEALSLEILDDLFIVKQTPINEPIPSYLLDRLVEGGERGFLSITRTDEEISMIYSMKEMPNEENLNHDSDLAKWRCIKIRGPLDFGLTGVLCSFTTPLRAAGIPVFVLSTWNTDYVLVSKERVQEAKKTLLQDGWKFL